MRHIFGRYNSIYFGWDGGRIATIGDRSLHKAEVAFKESDLVDTSGQRRDSQNLAMEGEMPHGDRAITHGGRHFMLVGPAILYSLLGFGRSLEYVPVESNAGGNTVLLTVKLPSHVRYGVSWSPTGGRSPSFELDEGIRLSVLTELEWAFEDGVFSVETGSGEGTVTFLVESLPKPSAVSNTAIVVARGSEKCGVLARAALGDGFVPCFVIDKEETESTARRLFQSGVSRVLAVGLPGMAAADDLSVVSLPPAATCSSELAAVANLSARGGGTVECDGSLNTLGGALFLAITLESDLRFNDECDDVVWRSSNGSEERRWQAADLLGTILSNDRHLDTVSSDSELIVAESTDEDLLVCQAVGFASLRNARIAFVSTADASADVNTFSELKSACERVIPERLRRVDARTLVVFTRKNPLHLTRSGDEYWFQVYNLAHLPQQLASTLVPRLHRKQAEVRPEICFSVIFDALGSVATEATSYLDQLNKGMSYPIALTGNTASRPVLRETLETFETDMILLICHGSGDSLEDCRNDRISSAEIGEWLIKGSPVVFNNSCSSWTTTGGAFIEAGASGYIGTLWPVANDRAAIMGAHVGALLHGTESPDVAKTIAEVQRKMIETDPGFSEDVGAYFYVGLPGNPLLTPPPLGEMVELRFLSGTFGAVFNALEEMVLKKGRPELAAKIHGAVIPALENRIRSFLVEGEVPIPFQPFDGTILDIGYIVALSNYGFGRLLLGRLPHEAHPSVLQGMDGLLMRALKELVEWDERHDKHMGRSAEERRSLSQQFGVPMGHDGGEQGFYRRAAKFVLDCALPFCADLCANHEDERARFWVDVSSKLVTTPRDLSEDGSVSDEALIARIREGLLVQHRLLRSSDEIGSRKGDLIDIDLLASSVNKSELANRFGVVFKRLDERARAARYFRLAMELAESGDRRANAASNLASLGVELEEFEEAYRGFEAAIEAQIAEGDFSNAITTGANTLRLLASQGRGGVDDLLGRALGWAEQLQTFTDRANARSDLLGAATEYYAALGDDQRVDEVWKALLPLLNVCPKASVALNEILVFYEKKGDFRRAVKRAQKCANELEKAGLPDVAARTYAGACWFALQASEGYRKEYFEEFLGSAQRFGRLLNRQPRIMDSAADFVETTWANVEGLWEQFAERDDRTLAAEAYRTVKVWKPKRVDPRGEALLNLQNRRNEEAVRKLAERRQLRRHVAIELQNNGQNRVKVATRRMDPVSEDRSIPEFIYVYWPIYEDTKLPDSDGVTVVGQTAICELRRDVEVELVQHTRHGVRTDGAGRFLYEESWGSKSIPYKLDMTFTGDLVPIELRWEMETGQAPPCLISFGSGQCSMTIAALTEEVDAWFGRLTVFYSEIPELKRIFENEGLFKEPTPYPMYMLLIRHLSGQR